MTAELLPSPKWRLTKSNGTPAAGYVVYTYEVGGAVTAKATFTTPAADVSNGASFTLDARGEADVWWDGAYYIAIYKPASEGGGLLYAIDNYGTQTAGVLNIPNLTANGSFEDGVDGTGAPNGWDLTTYTGSTFSIETSGTPHGGKAAKAISTGSGGAQLISEDFTPCSESESLAWRFMLKSSVVDVRNLVEIVWYDEDQVLLSATSVYDESAANPTSWATYQGMATPVSSARYFKTRVTLCHSSDSTAGTSWIDGIQISGSPLFSASKALLLEGPINYVTASGTNTYTATFSPALRALVEGCEYAVKFTNANTSTTPTLNLNSLGAKTIKRLDGTVLFHGDIAASGQHVLRYDGTDLILLNPTNASSTLISGSGYNLAVNRNTAAQVTVTADELVVKNSAGASVVLSSLSAIADLSLSGVSGLDTGAEANSTHYAVWALRKTNPIVAASVTVDNTTDVITHTAHGMAANTPVQVGGSVVPTGLSALTTYYIRDIATDTYKLAATPGGAAINITSNGTAVTVTEHPALVFSTSYTSPTLPTGYTFYALVSSARNDGSGNILGYNQTNRDIYYWAGQSVLPAGTATSDTAITISAYVPAAAKKFKFMFDATNAGATDRTVYFGFVASNNAVQARVGGSTTGSQDNSAQIEFPNVSQGLYYHWTSVSSSSVDAYINGFSI